MSELRKFRVFGDEVTTVSGDFFMVKDSGRLYITRDYNTVAIFNHWDGVIELVPDLVAEDANA